MWQNPCKTLGFKKSMVYKIPPGGGGKPYPASGLYQNFPCDLIKKMNTHTLCFCPLIRKLQSFEILKWAQGSQWRKQRTSNFTREIQLIFSLQ